MTFSRVLVLAAFVVAVVDAVLLVWARDGITLTTGVGLLICSFALYLASLLVP